jgi:ABC-type branched-subunit amino acid transport system ATPase component/branched-subunit amino acid ABC-type transport system permease component
MLNDILKFATLGLGAGAVYGLSALGIVLIYRGSGVLNFAQGAIGMVGAYVFYLNREDGMAVPLAAALAIGLGAVIGAVTHLGVMRPLRDAPAVTRLIGTLAVFSFLYGFGQYQYGINQARIMSAVLPTGSWQILPDIRIGTDRIIILASGAVLTVVLTLVYRYTKFGLATAAVAENRRASAAVGVSPDVVATINWMLGSVLAVCSAILIVSIGTLQVESLTLLVFPALAAALLGGFKSFGLTFLGGLLIGILESEVAYIGTQVSIGDGWGKTVPFIVIIAVMMLTGRALPMRGEATEEPPEIGTGEIRKRPLAIAIAVTLAMVLFWFSPAVLSAFEISMAVGLVVLSAVVVTGYAGQLSLAQMALAGMGAWIAARLVANWGVPFELAFLAGVFGAIPIGVAVGLPALRTRGMNLAVVTLGLAVVAEAQILGDPERTGGFVGTVVGAPEIFGLSLDTYAYPVRYALFCFAIFLALALMVANLRRGRAGRRLVAVRANERAAASLGISVVRSKLFAFAIGAGLAGCGGVLLAFRQPTVVFVPTFSSFQSIFVIVFAVIGGIGFLVGALIGGLNAPAGFLPTGLSTVLDGWADGAADFISQHEVAQMLLGLTLVLILLQMPNGLATHPVPPPIKRALERRRERRGADAPQPRPQLPEPEPFQVTPMTVRIDGLTVRFGGVVAADQVTMELRPGQVHGLIGPNGAGKTTLIDAVTGFVPLAAGTVMLDDADITDMPVLKRARAGVSRSFQSLELFETMTVRENLLAACDRQDQAAFLTNLVKPGRDEYSPAALAAIHEFELQDDLERRPRELSYGRRRLVAIARAVASGPSVLLLDEPAAGLDDEETAELGRLIVRLAREWGIAVLLVEHNVSVVLAVSDQVSVLNFGAVIANGTPDEVRNDPAVLAAYLGEDADSADNAVVGADDPQIGEAAMEADMAIAGVRERATDHAPEAPARTDPRLPLVEAVGVSAGYGELAAVRGLDLRVAPGEIVALLGPNGAGKTTTLLTLAGELKPMAGTIEWSGDDDLKPLHRRSREGLGFVPEERSVFMQLDAGDNLRLGAGGVDAAVAIFPELGELLRRRAGLLSGGEQQMLTLARTLAASPSLLLVDELSLGLAPLIVERLFDEVRKAADRGVGVILVEQQVNRALDIADRVYILRRGEVEFEGTPDEIRADRSRIQDAYLSSASPPAAVVG